MLTHTIKIPVNRYYHQLLTISLGDSPYKANPRRATDKLIMASFIDRDKKPLRISKKEEFTYEIIIPQRWILRYGITFITEESIDDLLETLEYDFKHKLYTYIDGVLEFKDSYNKLNKAKIVATMKDATIQFLHKYGFNEDIMKFETVKKGYQRYKQKEKTIAA